MALMLLGGRPKGKEKPMWDIPDETHSNVPHDLPEVIGNVPIISEREEQFWKEFKNPESYR